MFLQLRQAEFGNREAEFIHGTWGPSRVGNATNIIIGVPFHQQIEDYIMTYFIGTNLVFLKYIYASLHQSLETISDITFTVSEGGTTAICSLLFDTNLRKIDYAEVELYYKVIFLVVALTPRCHVRSFTPTERRLQGLVLLTIPGASTQ